MPSQRFAVECLEARRMLALGDLDPSFGQRGLAIIPELGPDAVGDAGEPNQILVLPDKKILVLGTRKTAHHSDINVVRLNAGGSVDRSFGLNGVASFDLAKWDAPAAMLRQKDGKILIATLVNGKGVYANRSAHLFRVTADGALDATFGNNGLSPDGVYGEPRDLALGPDGSIFVAG